MSSQHATLRIRPRISLNQLARYSTASAPERDQIVRAARERTPPPVIYYQDAEAAISEFLVSGDEQHLRRAIAEAMAEHPLTEQATTRRYAQVAALNAALTSLLPNLDSISRTHGERRPTLLSVEGVELSVRPEILLSWSKGGRDHVGAIKLLFAKTDPIGEREAALSLAALAHFLELNGEVHVVPSRCYLFDVFAMTFHQAPTATMKRWKEIESCCREIAWRWGKV